MTCNCKTEIEARLLENAKAAHPNANVLGAELMGYSVAIVDNKGVLLPTAPVHVHMNITTRSGETRRRKFVQTMVASFCPYCGVRA